MLQNSILSANRKIIADIPSLSNPLEFQLAFLAAKMACASSIVASTDCFSEVKWSALGFTSLL
jgi:hypothetical protein